VPIAVDASRPNRKVDVEALTSKHGFITSVFRRTMNASPSWSLVHTDGWNAAIPPNRKIVAVRGRMLFSIHELNESSMASASGPRAASRSRWRR
jgi:hypothetical protein